MDEPNWAKVLQYIYDGENEVEFPLEDDSRNLKGGEIGIDLGGKEIENSLEFLTNHNLIETYYDGWEFVEHTPGEGYERENPSIRRIELKTEGFEVAHERELTRSQHETNKRATRLSGYLVVAIIIQTLTSSWASLNNLFSAVMVGLAILGLLLLVMNDVFHFE